MGNFVDFVIAAQKDKGLLAKFLQADTVADLEALFSKEYSMISSDDCRKLLAAKEQATAQSATSGVWPQY